MNYKQVLVMVLFIGLVVSLSFTSDKIGFNRGYDEGEIDGAKIVKEYYNNYYNCTELPRPEKTYSGYYPPECYDSKKEFLSQFPNEEYPVGESISYFAIGCMGRNQSWRFNPYA